MQNTTKKSAIQNITLALVNGSKPTNPKKPSKAVVMLSDSDTLKAVSLYAEGITLGDKALDTLNNAVKMFTDKGVKLCKASEKTSPLFDYSNKVRTMFVDSFTTLGKKKTYIEKMLYPAFLKAVNSGKELTAINASQEKAKAKNKDKKTTPQGIDTLIAKVIGHEGFYDLPENLQYEIRDYLESEGYEITE